MQKMKYRIVRNALRMSVTLPICLASVAPAGAQTAADAADAQGAEAVVAQHSLLDRRYEFRIAEQKLSTAVLELSRQADIQIMMPGRELDAYTAAAVEGQMSVGDALGRLLADTPYSYRQGGGNIIIVDAAPAGLSMEPDADPDQLAAAAEPASGAPGVNRLDDIIVTATKREKSAREVPVSLTALRGEDLEKIGARDIRDYLMLAPGITLDETETGEAIGRRMTIRGVGAGEGGGNQTVGQFIGDVPMGDPYTNYGVPDLDPFDLKTVEILRGPQGTTFGASALNGAIRYVPNEPELGILSGRGFVDHLSLQDGDADFSYGLAANAPIGDTAAFRAAGVLSKAPGYYDNLNLNDDDANSVDKWTGRSALRWEPTDRFSANLLYLKQDSQTDDVLVANNPDGRLENSEKNARGYIDFAFSLASLDLRYRLDDWGTVVLQGTRQTKLSEGSVDAGRTLAAAFGVQTLASSFRTDVEGDTYELRLVSPDGGRWDWIVGAFRRDYEAFVNASIDTDTIKGLQAAEILPLDAKETAFYGELTRRFGEHWEATVGARRYTTKLDGVFVGRALGGAVELYNQPIEQSEDGVNPKFSLAYKPSKDLMAYATVARGFQFGGANQTAVTPGADESIPETYDSSVLWSREIGVRSDWLERTLRLDVAVYDIRWSDAQLSQQTAGTVVPVTYIDNVGEVTSRGAEASFTWLTPVPGLTANVAASYVRAKTASDYENGGNVTPEGTQMPAAPRWQTASSLSYTTYFGPWIAGGTASYSQWGPAYNDIRGSSEIYDFGMLGLNIVASRPDLPFMPMFTLGITNLTDERGLVGRTMDNWTYTRPRAISLRVSAEFN